VDSIDRVEDAENRLAKALAENSKLLAENQRLRKLLDIKSRIPGIALGSEIRQPSVLDTKSTSDEKIRRFRTLFRGREDVYAVRWEAKGGKSGYSPAYVKDGHTWFKSKVEAKQKRNFLPLTDHVIRDHLLGKQTIGIYPLLQDETCRFLAVDFDKTTWAQDAIAFLGTCSMWDIPAYLERSRSGNGVHVWIFLDEPLKASLVRKMGAAVLTRTMEQRHQLGLDSYDRFFPNQDTMPKGGFGNLIALPLQHFPRTVGNSIFLQESLEPYEDQWVALASVQRLKSAAVEEIVAEAERAGRVIGVRLSLCDEDAEVNPWSVSVSKEPQKQLIRETLPAKTKVTLANLVYVEKRDLPSAMLNRLMRLAAFQNPEFYRTQAMRLSTFGKPRIIRCAEEFPRHLGLPRGCFEQIVELLESHGTEVEIRDERFLGTPIDMSFHGELRPEQKQAAEMLFAHDIGILSATTAFGKTVVAAWLIAARKVNTLILVHRRQLLDQWRERLALFFDLPKKEIGQIGGGSRKPSGRIDVAVIQSLNRKHIVDDIVEKYGHVVVDECHHLSAFSFEQVLRGAKARYVLGLTATPIRKDGHHPIIIMQCGPIRYRVNPRIQARNRPFGHFVVPRFTGFCLPLQTREPEINEIYSALIHDEQRNEMIVRDLLNVVRQGRTPIVLTERTVHLEHLQSQLTKLVKHVVVFRGGMGAKQRKSLSNQLSDIPDDEGRVLLATGRYLGEGFDYAPLDTLFLAIPISWRGTLHQYVGRLHRLHDQKKEVVVYDYVDTHVPMLLKMFNRRRRGYEAVGYAIGESRLV